MLVSQLLCAASTDPLSTICIALTSVGYMFLEWTWGAIEMVATLAAEFGLSKMADQAPGWVAAACMKAAPPHILLPKRSAEISQRGI